MRVDTVETAAARHLARTASRAGLLTGLTLGLAVLGGCGGASAPAAGSASQTASPAVAASGASPQQVAPVGGAADAVAARATDADASADADAGANAIRDTPIAREAAAQLLVQASYGPTTAEIDRAAAMGPAAWIEDQFDTPPMDTHWAYVMVRRGPLGCTVCNAQHINATMESFWTQAVRGPDQLRQRTVLALSELFVVSTVNSAVDIQADAHASYLDMLARNAFGNFRVLLEQVSTHPTMAHYLSHMKNQKEDAATGRIPDENFAREVMQLFTIGLWQLNEDGSRKRDAHGRDMPTFEQADVMGLAKVFTGWSWNGPDQREERWQGWLGSNWKDQLQNYPAYHSSSEKRFLGAVVPAGSSGAASLRIALDTLFNHPNTGPFIGRQLIQRFVNSNPSADHVRRVARAFADNGSGSRGDMKAVLRAVLLDPEARGTTRAAVRTANHGKLREPMVRFGSWMRAFDAKAANGYYAIWNLEDPVTSIGQNPLRAPSVFNWFRPDYAPPGGVSLRNLVAPEFQITHETTVTGYANFVVEVVDRGFAWGDGNIRAGYAAELALAADAPALLEHLNLLLLAGAMEDTTRQTILAAVQAIPASARRQRVITAVALVMLAPEFIVQK